MEQHREEETQRESAKGRRKQQRDDELEQRTIKNIKLQLADKQSCHFRTMKRFEENHGWIFDSPLAELM